ncbi:MAG: sigma-54-dependent Fis family transcriptional regulator [Thalassobius sp.]|nr:sigma-54-dependent Fis family transcriptional regulator [Thalassovita sp.]
MEKIDGNILIIDDDPDVLHTAKIIFKRRFKLVKTEEDPKLIPVLLESYKFDVILLDMNYTNGAKSGAEGLKWLKQVHEISPLSSVVVITAYADINLAVQAMKVGAVDFAVKPWDNEKLLATVMSAYKLSQSQKEVSDLRKKQRAFHQTIASNRNMIGESPAFKKVLETVEKVADTDASVLILGENGTGKELVAHALHQLSARHGEAFVKVDLGAIPASLFESELFGHNKGAFTDARTDREGRFEIADKGTLFLDEIANLSLPLQAKLLSVLQNREIFRVGSSTAIPIDVRLICATNVSLEDLHTENKFRQDLLYRLNTVEIMIPPLRERKEDIPLLINHFFEIHKNKYRKPELEINQAAMKRLMNYNWPGNIRELQHAIERAVIMADTDQLQISDFILKENQGKGKDDSSNLNMEEVEKKALITSIQKHHGNLSKVANELGLSRPTIYRKMKKYGI